MTTERVENSQQGAAHPTDAEVRQALERIVTQAPFAQSLRLSKFLAYVVEETLAGRGDKIGGYSVGLDVFDKPDDFDPRTDTNVRVEAGRLRRRLDDYYRGLGAEDMVRIIVPKGSYVPRFHVRGEAQATQPAAPVDAPAASDRKPSIAVLPFDNFGATTDDQFFADGLTEETIANLARFRELSVFSRTTTAKLAKDGLDLRELHDRLGADFVVEGSVRKSSDTVRVTVQLVDAATDAHILAEKLERPCTPEGVFEIQDEMALLIAGRIADHHGPIGRYISRARRMGQSRLWETYAWISRFHEYYATHQPELHLDLRQGLAAALERDEDSSDALAAFSIILLDEFRLHINERHGFPALETSLAYAHRAVACDPDSAFAYHALAMVYFHRGDVVEFRTAANRALGLNPGHADMLADLGSCHCNLGDWDRGLPLVDRAIDLSPAHPGWYRLIPSCHHALNGDFEDAVSELKSAPIPGMIWYHANLVWFFAELGWKQDLAKELAALRQVFPDVERQVVKECDVWQLNDRLRGALIAGLRKAGLDVRAP